MLGAQARGHRLYHYAAEALSWADGRLWTMAHPVTVQRVAGDHYRFGEPEILDLGRDADVVLMRQDPPFDLGYITATHLLERIQGETLVVNDPGQRPQRAGEGLGARLCPLHAADRGHPLARASPASSWTEHGEIVVKPLHGNGGKAVFKVGSDGANLASLIEVFNTAYREPHMIQAFLPGVAEGDKRIVFVDGEVAGAVNRIPGEGEIRSNLAVGGKAAKTELTPREEEICAALGPELKERGLLFVGIDVIGGEWLTEINVTSPTGIVAIDRFNGTDTPARIWDAIEGKLAR